MEQKYAGLIERIKAAIIDGIVMVIIMFGFYKVFGFFGEVSDVIRGSAMVFVFVLYDPITTSMFGATLGHSSVGIMVKRFSDETRNIPFPMALLRFITKVVLGWVSLLSVSLSDNKRAVHDFVAGSVVMYQQMAEE